MWRLIYLRPHTYHRIPGVVVWEENASPGVYVHHRLPTASPSRYWEFRLVYDATYSELRAASGSQVSSWQEGKAFDVIEHDPSKYRRYTNRVANEEELFAWWGVATTDPDAFLAWMML